MLEEYVDTFFIDTSSATVEMPSGALKGTFAADYFGACVIRKESIGILRDDLQTLAALANAFFERLSTECASHGAMPAAQRPLTMPFGYSLAFTPCAADC